RLRLLGRHLGDAVLRHRQRLLDALQLLLDLDLGGDLLLQLLVEQRELRLHVEERAGGVLAVRLHRGELLLQPLQLALRLVRPGDRRRQVGQGGGQVRQRRGGGRARRGGERRGGGAGPNGARRELGRQRRRGAPLGQRRWAAGPRIGRDDGGRPRLEERFVS